VKTGGGTVNHVMSEIDVVCLPADLPNYIEVDLTNLEMGHSIHLSELKLPAGVESSQLRGGNDSVVATIAIPRAEAEPEPEVAAAAEAAAPGAAAPGAAAPAAEDKKEEKKGDKDKK
jgi:large subunit ribosomal protein L25